MKPRHYSLRKPPEEEMTAEEWRSHVQRQRVDAPYTAEERLRMRAYSTGHRELIAHLATMNVLRLQAYVDAKEGAFGIMFTDGDKGVNKAKLRTDFNFSHLLRMIRTEAAHYIAKGQILKHKRHLTQD